jgi:hypothetical protein
VETEKRKGFQKERQSKIDKKEEWGGERGRIERTTETGKGFHKERQIKIEKKEDEGRKRYK